MKMIRHIVLINWKEGVASGDIQDWVVLCNRIPDECPMVYNWFSSYSIAGPDPAKPSTHEFCLHFDLRSRIEWDQYLAHPWPNRIYSEGEKIIDLDRTASVNMVVDAEPVRTSSRLWDREV